MVHSSIVPYQKVESKGPLKVLRSRNDQCMTWVLAALPFPVTGADINNQS